MVGNRIIHIVAPWTGGGGLAQRQQLFLESVDRAQKGNVVLLASVKPPWQRAGWTRVEPQRQAGVDDGFDKPYLRDLLDHAAALAQPHDWLLCGNVDCSITEDFYQYLAERNGSVVEFQRQDVDDNPQTLEELFSFRRKLYPAGLDAFAIRASVYRDLRPYFPDFILGDPHWDPALSGILRNLFPVERESTRLFHPKHVQTWDLSRLSSGGEHNSKILVDAITYGWANDIQITEAANQSDTAVVVAVFGADPIRIAAHIQALREQLRTDLWVDFYLVELLYDGESHYPEEILSRVRHLKVRGSAANRDLFQKEALLNLGWRAALEHHKYDYFLFVDADIYCERPDWFRQIRAKLRQDPTCAVQGFGIVSDTLDPDFQWCSIAADSSFQSSDLSANPGICWGLHRDLLLAGDGLNISLPCAGGDSLFVAEYLNSPEASYDRWLYQYRFFHEICRDLPVRARLEYVPVKLVHCHHGHYSDRVYGEFCYALDCLPAQREWLRVDEKGLLAWKDPDGAERTLWRQSPRMKSRAAVDELFRELGMEPRKPAPPLPAWVERTKPFLKIPHWTRPTELGLLPCADKTPAKEVARQLLVFHPREIYRSTFLSSWCENVKTEAKNRIPMLVRDGCPRLILEGLQGVPWITGILPLNSFWQGQDLTDYHALHLTLQASAENLPILRVGLLSSAGEGLEVCSEEVNLHTRGLGLGERACFTIPLADFWNDFVDRTSIRLIRLIAVPQAKHPKPVWLRRWPFTARRKSLPPPSPAQISLELSQVYID